MKLTLKQMWMLRKQEPTIVIGQFGWLTDKPKVDVSICSRTGKMGVFVYTDDTQGNAQADLDAHTLAHITGLPLDDQRHPLVKQNKELVPLPIADRR